MYNLPVDYTKLHYKEKRAVREQYIQEQQGLCCHCKHPLDGKPEPEVFAKPINWRLFPDGFLKNPVHLHHCHKTGFTIGAVHAYCNAVLWQYHGE